MKKHPLDKTKQQFKLGEAVFAVTQRNRADCLVEGKVCAVSKPFDDEDAEVVYTVGDISDNVDALNRFVTVTYDDIFKDLDAAKQKALDAITLTCEKAKERLTDALNVMKAAPAEKQSPLG